MQIQVHPLDAIAEYSFESAAILVWQSETQVHIPKQLFESNAPLWNLQLPTQLSLTKMWNPQENIRLKDDMLFNVFVK